jgi:hypothetical protein
MATYEEMVKQAAARADAVIEREVFVPAIIKSAVANGVPEPRTEQDVLNILDTVQVMSQAKSAFARGEFPELRAQLPGGENFRVVADMAKRAAAELCESRGDRQYSPELLKAGSELVSLLGAAAPAAPAAKSAAAKPAGEAA